MEFVEYKNFAELDIRSGSIISVTAKVDLIKPAYQLLIDFGPEIGTKKSSAQLMENYTPDDLLGKQILAVVNFRPRQIADFMSEVLVLALLNEEGKDAVLIVPDKEQTNGRRLF